MYNCLNCKIDVYKSDGCYMLNDSIWNQIHNSKSGFLCISCVEIKLIDN
jgi:cAMP phosphodiesterase